jgi:hypothetical protein|tara:strand:+ start:683 stop:970 length:288 start_codon:yes stop_codon:yes gene_type:complete
MAITKTIEIGAVEVVTKYKHIQVRTDTIIKEDDKELSRTHHRNTLCCGNIDEGNDNAFVDTDISGQDAQVQQVCGVYWTQAVKDDWKAKLIADKG